MNSLIATYAGTLSWQYILSVPAWTIVLFTATVQLNDIKLKQYSPRWIFRRIACLLAIVSSAMIISKPFTLSGLFLPQITYLTPTMGWGWALFFMTTSGRSGLPWSKYMREDGCNSLENS